MQDLNLSTLLLLSLSTKAAIEWHTVQEACLVVRRVRSDFILQHRHDMRGSAGLARHRIFLRIVGLPQQPRDLMHRCRCQAHIPLEKSQAEVELAH